MRRTYQQIETDRRGDVFCVSMKHRKLSEGQVLEMVEEVRDLIDEDGCRKLALSLGPGSPECLYSVFLAKLFQVRRRLLELDGHMVLCDVTPDVMEVFEACHLTEFFEFSPDFDAACTTMAG